MSSALSIGLSALQTSQQLLNTTGENIANANTVGYHLQTPTLAPLDVGNPTGDGVTITGVSRSYNSLLENAINQNTVAQQNTTTQLNALQQFQSQLAPSTGGLSDQLGNFFNQLEQLATTPSDLAQRSVVLDGASNLSNTLNSLSTALAQQSTALDTQATQVVTNINSAATQIAALNTQIQQATLTHAASPNDLLDQRDQLVNQLAQYVNIQVITTNSNEVNIIAAGVPVVIGSTTLPLQYSPATGTQPASFVQVNQGTAQLNVTGGQAAGILQVRNGDLATLRSNLDTLSKALATGLDELQATGLGLSGSLTTATSTRPVADPTAALNSTAAGLAFPPTAGDLYVSVTDPSGNRTLQDIKIDPTGATPGAVKSLNDLAGAVNTISVGTGTQPLTATVNSAAGTIQIVAANGYSYDFAGRLPSSAQAVTGTISPTIGGSYTGTTNDLYTYKVVGGPGTVGVTSGLSLEAFSQNDAVNPIATFNIGQGYSSGTPLSVNGVSVGIAAGNVGTTDSFQIPVTANPDTSNILTALGLNTMFTGSSAGTLAVNPSLLANPQNLAASKSGDVSDTTNLQSMLALQNKPTLANGTATYVQYFASIIGTLGSRVQDLTTKQTAQQAVGQQLSTQQQSVSGVDPNEQLINMLQYQQSFQMASKYISVISSTMDALLAIIQ